MYQALEPSNVHLIVYNGASFACYADETSQLGYLILLADGTARTEIIHFASRKAKNVVRSVLGAEICASADAGDVGIVLRHDLRAILRSDLPLRVLTDSSSLLSVVVHSTKATEKRLMIDHGAAREAFECKDVSKIGCILRELNLADGLTKAKPSSPLYNLMLIHMFDREVLQ